MGSRLMVALAAVGVMAFTGLSAAAQTPAPEQAPAMHQALPGMKALLQYVGTESYYRAIATAALAGEHDITPECKEAKALGRTDFTVLRLAQFKPGVDHPVAGLWKDQVEVDRCGKKVLHNVLVQARPDDQPHVGLLMPGTTAAPWAIQGEVFQSAAKTASAASGCNDPSKLIIYDTKREKVLSELKPAADGHLIGGKWLEKWDVRACGKIQPVAVTFTVGKDGKTTWDAKPETAKKK